MHSLVFMYFSFLEPTCNNLEETLEQLHFDKARHKQQHNSHFAATDFEKHQLYCFKIYSIQSQNMFWPHKTIILRIAPLPVGEHLQYIHQHNSFVACPQNHKYELCDTHTVMVETLTARKFHTR